MQLLFKFGEPLEGIPNIGLTPIKLAMPEQYKVDDPIQSYRNYYLAEKIQNKYWTNRKKADLDNWLSSQLLDSQFKVK